MEKITVTLNELKEEECYELYFKMMNITRTKEMQLPAQLIAIASKLAKKPMEYILDSQKSTSLKSKRAELAEELGMAVQAIYPQLQLLVDKKILLQDEDKFIRFNKQIDYFRQVIKNYILKGEPFSFDYTFSLNIKPDNAVIR